MSFLFKCSLSRCFVLLAIVWPTIADPLHSPEKWIRYTAAVVEYTPFTSGQARNSSVASAVKVQNAHKFHDLAVQAGEQKVQIVVFPEYSLFGPVLHKRSDTVLYAETLPDAGGCLQKTDSEALSILRDAANKSGAILVFHMAEADGPRLYSTQVALSPEGCILAKYRKYHLYGEAAWFDQPGEPDVVTFKTSFGVTFAMFICFDIMFGAPESVARARGITDFVFSSWWVNFQPLLLATQVQSAWAASMHANLLAANTGAGGWHSSGSGIYGFASAPGDERRSQTDMYHDVAPAPGSGSLLVEDVYSPMEGASYPTAAQSLAPGKLGSSPLACSPSPMAAGVTALGMGSDQMVSASADGLECRAIIHPTSSAGRGADRVTWSLVAVNGCYHGLFQLEMCAIVPCVKADLSCIDSLGSRRPGLVLEGNAAIAAGFVKQNTTLAFATYADGRLAEDSHIDRPNASALVLRPTRPLYALAVANRVYANEAQQSTPQGAIIV